ncbi:hypothetical protein [Polynucleobacter sp. AP-RePozz3-80-G7]|uniref:hypothetical protein n=1 Tax=Polynucleobacter sp. AP-RePozz3-80-G7 TaxID=2689105 RepID=UPI001C0C783A|nr:hypothetical protein [Polynucleobacter sp. AP-RePozz3-80-G7]MBU3639986.1 hypothetical protein [Polynucleobacter sp. AP-RePozz3-80-G7]
MKPHKHAELIKAWADGAEIEGSYLIVGADGWSEWEVEEYPRWYDPMARFRIKPEPKPDNVMFCKSTPWGVHSESGTRNSDHNLKQVFDGETGKLKSAEVLK